MINSFEVMSSVLEKLKGGDLRSIGRAKEVVIDILENPTLFGEVFDGMLTDNPIIRMRAADAVEKVSRVHPEYLKPHKQRLIKKVAKIEQQEVRWHVAQMFSYLELEGKGKKEVMSLLFSWLKNSKSNIVKVNSMQTLADLAKKDKNIRPLVIGKIKNTIRTGPPSVVGRGKKLIELLTG